MEKKEYETVSMKSFVNVAMYIFKIFPEMCKIASNSISRKKTQKKISIQLKYIYRKGS